MVRDHHNLDASCTHSGLSLQLLYSKLTLWILLGVSATVTRYYVLVEGEKSSTR